jgi:hypothetical protein
MTVSQQIRQDMPCFLLAHGKSASAKYVIILIIIEAF